MGVSGRKPGSRNTPRVTPQRAEDAPLPDLATVKPPKGLDKAAKAKWEEMSATLGVHGLLKILDGDALAVLCVIYSRWCRAEATLEKDGEVLDGPNGGKYMHPMLHVANRCIDQMNKMFESFGLTPLARSKLKMRVNTTTGSQAAKGIIDSVLNEIKSGQISEEAKNWEPPMTATG